MPTIEFIPANKEYGLVHDPPSPASLFLPDWYKDSIRDIPDGPKIISGLPSQTVKACMPVFDAITAGYILPCQVDITFNIMDEGYVDISWRSGEHNFVSIHNQKQLGEFKVSEEYWPQAFKFEHKWIFKTPPGYSTLFCTPYWRYDLPYYILPGIVDTDEHGTSVNFPFLLRKDWEGTIKYGDPLVQLIPFKREDWDHVTHSDKDDETVLKWKRAARSQKNTYKDHTRKVKVWK